MTDDRTDPPGDEPAAGTPTDPPGDTAGDTADGADADTTPLTAAAATGAPADPARRRRRLIIGGVAAAVVVLLLLGCLAAVGVVRAGARLVDRAERDERRRERLVEACLELETRLNRVTPPGAAAGDPRRRADAVRDENAAVEPFLAELAQLTVNPVGERRRPEHRGDRHRAALARDWRRLVEARAAYADALDRQAASGDPAFFVPPRGERDGSIASTLERRGPRTCAASVRRLARPDL